MGGSQLFFDQIPLFFDQIQIRQNIARVFLYNVQRMRQMQNLVALFQWSLKQASRKLWQNAISGDGNVIDSFGKPGDRHGGSVFVPREKLSTPRRCNDRSKDDFLSKKSAMGKILRQQLLEFIKVQFFDMIFIMIARTI